jgi:hypothetical protein
VACDSSEAAHLDDEVDDAKEEDAAESLPRRAYMMWALTTIASGLLWWWCGRVSMC